MTGLFNDPVAPAPLADQLRPQTLDDVLGQSHLTAPQGTLARMIASGRLASLILWGPPGTGKTSIARLLAAAVGCAFEPISAVFSGVGDLKKIFDQARMRTGRQTLVFVDEIHRFNRAQQDSFLPYVEDGTIVLVGATTENPSFALNGALLSRAQVLLVHPLDHSALEALLERAEQARGRPLPLRDEARQALIEAADGDGRFLINQADVLLGMSFDAPLDRQAVQALLMRRLPHYDKDRDGHYGLISALHKSLRGSDVDAALYYLARMLVAGEEPLYILRRLVRFACEDIGLADPQALVQALAAKEAYQFLGSPEGEIALVQASIYLATAPKSNAAYRAEKASKALARASGSVPPPLHILNAPTALMKDLGYGKDYVYDPDTHEGFSGASYWPEPVQAQTLYTPVARGFEREVRKRLDYWAALRARKVSDPPS